MPESAPAPYNPIETNQNWQNEFGFIDSFSSPNPSRVGDALRHGGVGLGAGAVAGGLTGRNPWLTGANTAIGATAGNLLTSLLTQNMTDAGARGAYTSLGSILGGAGGMGLSTLMQDKRDKNKHLDVSIPLPGAHLSLSTKKASINDVVRNISSQVPAIRLPDSIAGGALGAAGGLAYNAFKDDAGASPREKKRRMWSRTLSGAGLGAAGANVAGDRFRRYVSNKIYPFGYDVGDRTLSLAPSNFKQVWDGAVLDKPLQPEVQDYMAGKTTGPNVVEKDWVATPREITARRELLRRGLGVHTENAKKDMWLKQPDGSVSLNPSHPDVTNSLKEFLYPSNGADPSQRGDYRRMQMMLRPDEAVASINNTASPSEYGMMSNITGGQRIADYPYRRSSPKGTYQDHLLKIQDRWDFGLDSSEKTRFMNYLKSKYTKGTASLVPRGPGYNVAPPEASAQDVSNAEALSYTKRLALEHLMLKDAPWVSQRLYMHKLPANPIDYRADTGYAAIPSTAAGQLYPGKSIGVFEPLKPDGSEWAADQESQQVGTARADGLDPFMSMHTPEEIMPKLKAETYVPRVRPREQP